MRHSQYSLEVCEKLIEDYTAKGGKMLEIQEGSLGLGVVLLYGLPRTKSILISEFFLNGWSSGHKIRMYNKLPKKYQSLID